MGLKKFSVTEIVCDGCGSKEEIKRELDRNDRVISSDDMIEPYANPC